MSFFDTNIYYINMYLWQLSMLYYMCTTVKNHYFERTKL
jgi:hypothetical protein